MNLEQDGREDEGPASSELPTVGSGLGWCAIGEQPRGPLFQRAAGEVSIIPQAMRVPESPPGRASVRGPPWWKPEFGLKRLPALIASGEE